MLGYINSKYQNTMDSWAKPIQFNPSEGLLVLVTGCTGAGKSTLCKQLGKLTQVKVFSEEDEKVPNTSEPLPTVWGEAKAKIRQSALTFAGYGRTVLVDIGEEVMARCNQDIQGLTCPYMTILVYCNLQDLPWHVHWRRTGNDEWFPNLYNGLRQYGMIYTGRVSSAKGKYLQYLTKQDVNATVEAAFALMKVDRITDEDTKVALYILRDFLLRALHLDVPGRDGVYIYSREPADLVINSSNTTEQRCARVALQAMKSTYDNDSTSVLGGMSQVGEDWLTYSCPKCDSSDFIIELFPCRACLDKLADLLLQIDADAPPLP